MANGAERKLGLALVWARQQDARSPRFGTASRLAQEGCLSRARSAFDQEAAALVPLECIQPRVDRLELSLPFQNPSCIRCGPRQFSPPLNQLAHRGFLRIAPVFAGACVLPGRTV